MDIDSEESIKDYYRRLFGYNGEKIDTKVSDKIGYLPEVGSLIDSYTVYEQCLYYGRMKNMKDDEIKNNMFELLERFGNEKN